MILQCLITQKYETATLTVAGNPLKADFAYIKEGLNI